MKKILYVHVGTTKTGTTAIQSFCIDNQEVLNRQGDCYPLFPYRYKDVSERRNAHFLVADAQDVSGGHFREGMDRIRGLFEEYPNVILSDEGIWSATYEQRISMWRALKAEAKEAGFRVKVIVYLRRQDMYLISGWNTHSRVIWTSSMESSRTFIRSIQSIRLPGSGSPIFRR